MYVLCWDSQNRLRLLYRGSEHGFTHEEFWRRCEGKSNTLILVKVRLNPSRVRNATE